MRRSAPRALCLLWVSAAGCYSGDWKLGPEVPIGTTHHLLPTRDVETWQVEPTVTPYVVRIHADMQPRCRAASYGSSRRTDVATFHREGGQYWKNAAIATGVTGAVAGLVGSSGWISQTSPYGAPAMYAVGGLFAAGGLVNCILIAQQTGGVVRKALCGGLLGGGAALLGGAALSQTVLPLVTTPPLQTQQTNPALKDMTFAGAAALGAAGLMIIPAALWKGDSHQTRIVDQPDKKLWDASQPETTCGSGRPLVGRTATLEVSAERTPDGPGSEAEPLKLRVALTDEGSATVDLRPLRQGMADCGVMRVQLAPDTLYEQFSEDWLPQTPPHEGVIGRPIQGLVIPRAGFTLRAMESKGRKLTARVSLPGIEEDLLSAVGRRCRAEVAQAEAAQRAEVQKGEEAAKEAQRAAAAAQAALHHQQEGGAAQGEKGEGAQRGGASAESAQHSGAPAESAQRSGAPSMVSAQRGGASGAEAQHPPGPAPGTAAECSAQVRQVIQRDCELSCSKSLEISQCVFDRRKCLIDARYGQQKERNEELCELAWEKCLFKVGIGPGAWGRCVESCQRRNEPPSCRPAVPAP